MPESSQQPTLKVNTSRFGQIEIAAQQVLTLPQGMVGFPILTRYAILQHRPGSPFHWLQSLEKPELAFVVMNPLVFDPEYNLALPDADARRLQINDPAQVQVWVVVNIPHGEPEKMTANFKAPLVVNLEKRLAAQVIMDDPRYPLRQTVKK